MVDVSDSGVCLDVGGMAVPKVFGLSFTSGGEVMRLCTLIWRRGETLGARFVTAKELRQVQGKPAASDSKPQTVLI